MAIAWIELDDTRCANGNLVEKLMPIIHALNLFEKSRSMSRYCQPNIVVIFLINFRFFSSYFSFFTFFLSFSLFSLFFSLFRSFSLFSNKLLTFHWNNEYQIAMLRYLTLSIRSIYSSFWLLLINTNEMNIWIFKKNGFIAKMDCSSKKIDRENGLITVIKMDLQRK